MEKNRGPDILDWTKTDASYGAGERGIGDLETGVLKLVDSVTEKKYDLTTCGTLQITSRVAETRSLYTDTHPAFPEDLNTDPHSFWIRMPHFTKFS